MPTVKEILAALQEKLADPAKMKGTTAIYQFVLTGGEAGSYFVKFDDGAATIQEGAADSPDITITMDAEDFKSMIGGQLNPTMAFMSGKLQVKGDMSLAMKLQTLLG
ncbi:sterol-binding domain protein [Desulfocucumis palustris]|uniref:Sterol-binding domain protein n=1 Tax=Desulfocucumis palustris TaxID=1898651 RepID=A0A2L2X9X4_9FIRM|nr:SCP2 sterol-binding domain-containing protein [Desulfocucumis palustris]GBF32948.1 sterol-binding domain protein [Desulfocucumis palustris]